MMDAHAKPMYLPHLANDLCRSCMDEEEEERMLHLLGTCPALCVRRKRYLGAYNFENLQNLSGIDMGIQNLLIGWFL